MNNRLEPCVDSAELRDRLQVCIASNRAYCELRRLLPKISHLRCLQTRVVNGNKSLNTIRLEEVVARAQEVVAADKDQFFEFAQFLTRLEADPDFSSQEVLKEAGRLIPVAQERSRKLLSEIKLARKRLAQTQPAKSAASFGSEEVLWRYMLAIIHTMEQLASCNKYLDNVRSEAYILKYTERRCDLNVQLSERKQQLSEWRDRNQSEQSSLWAKHGELVNVMLTAVDAEVTEPLVAAMKQDLERARQTHKISKTGSRASSSNIAATIRKGVKPSRLSSGDNSRRHISGKARTAFSSCPELSLQVVGKRRA